MLRPHLDDDEIEPIRALCLQNLRSLEDDPGSKVIYELRRRHFPDPWGRPSPGTTEGILSPLSPADLRRFLTGDVSPQRRDPGRRRRNRLAPAQRHSRAPLRRLEDGARAARTRANRRDTPRSYPGAEHKQIQIALAYPAATVASPDYYRARAAVAILGGYSSARLFTEVREKRGLCYSVYAAYECQLDRAAMICYVLEPSTDAGARDPGCHAPRDRAACPGWRRPR